MVNTAISESSIMAPYGGSALSSSMPLATHPAPVGNGLKIETNFKSVGMNSLPTPRKRSVRGRASAVVIDGHSSNKRPRKVQFSMYGNRTYPTYSMKDYDRTWAQVTYSQRQRLKIQDELDLLREELFQGMHPYGDSPERALALEHHNNNGTTVLHRSLDRIFDDNHQSEGNTHARRITPDEKANAQKERDELKPTRRSSSSTATPTRRRSSGGDRLRSFFELFHIGDRTEKHSEHNGPVSENEDENTRPNEERHEKKKNWMYHFKLHHHHHDDNHSDYNKETNVSINVQGASSDDDNVPVKRRPSTTGEMLGSLWGSFRSPVHTGRRHSTTA